MSCPQRKCLHEQQSIQELYVPQRRDCDLYNLKNNFSSDKPRTTSRIWRNHIEVVTQYDEHNKLDMNFFAKEDRNFFEYIDKKYEKKYVKYNPSNKPFFVQCSGLENKNKCLAKMLINFGLLPDKNAIYKIVKEGFPSLSRQQIMEDVFDLE